MRIVLRLSYRRLFIKILPLAEYTVNGGAPDEAGHGNASDRHNACHQEIDSIVVENVTAGGDLTALMSRI